MIRALLLGLACIACRDQPPQKQAPPIGASDAARPPDVLAGTIVVDGTPVAPVSCRVGRDGALFVEAITPRGTLRYANAQLVWKDTMLACTKLDRSWGGGSRLDGSHYWRGMLDFVCGPMTGASEPVPPSRAGAGMITGKLELECGGVTPEERAQLDANREKSRQD